MYTRRCLSYFLFHWYTEHQYNGEKYQNSVTRIEPRRSCKGMSNLVRTLLSDPNFVQVKKNIKKEKKRKKKKTYKKWKRKKRRKHGKREEEEEEKKQENVKEKERK